MAAGRGEVEIEFGGKPRTFRFGLTEVSELEKRLDSDVRSHFLGQKGMASFVRHAAFCGLLKTQKGITQPQVDDWLQEYRDKGGSQDDLGTLFFEAFARGLGADGEPLVKYIDDIKARIARDKAREAAEETGIPFRQGTMRELNPTDVRPAQNSTSMKTS